LEWSKPSLKKHSWRAGSRQRLFVRLGCRTGATYLKHQGQFCSPRGLAKVLAINAAVKNDCLEFLLNYFLQRSEMRQAMGPGDEKWRRKKKPEAMPAAQPPVSKW
jgi:hypothetical protein